MKTNELYIICSITCSIHYKMVRKPSSGYIKENIGYKMAQGNIKVATKSKEKEQGTVVSVRCRRLRMVSREMQRNES